MYCTSMVAWKHSLDISFWQSVGAYIGSARGTGWAEWPSWCDGHDGVTGQLTFSQSKLVSLHLHWVTLHELYPYFRVMELPCVA